MFDVNWVPPSEDQLAEVWTAAADRDAVTRATNVVERVLAARPLAVGEARSDGYRVLIEFPLVVYYDVSVSDRRVRVLKVVGWRA